MIIPLFENYAHFMSVSSADKLCKWSFLFQRSVLALPGNMIRQAGRPRSGPTSCQAWSGPKLFDTDGIPESDDFENNQ